MVAPQATDSPGRSPTTPVAVGHTREQERPHQFETGQNEAEEPAPGTRTGLGASENEPVPERPSQPFIRGLRQETDAGGLVLADEDIEIIPPQYDPSWNRPV